MILFIDDEAKRMNSHLLELEFHYKEVVFKKNVDEAYDFFLKHSDELELLILDIMMQPGKLLAKEETAHGLITGLPFYRLIRKKAPDLPIIIFTHKEDIEKEFREEMNCRYLRKRDYVPTQFVEAVKDFLVEFRVVG